jgi:hypothetical protein
MLGLVLLVWDSNGSNATIGHGLSKAPEMIILLRKRRIRPLAYLSQNARKYCCSLFK